MLHFVSCFVEENVLRYVSKVHLGILTSTQWSFIFSNKHSYTYVNCFPTKCIVGNHEAYHSVECISLHIKQLSSRCCFCLHPSLLASSHFSPCFCWRVATFLGTLLPPTVDQSCETKTVNSVTHVCTKQNRDSATSCLYFYGVSLSENALFCVIVYLFFIPGSWQPVHLCQLNERHHRWIQKWNFPNWLLTSRRFFFLNLRFNLQMIHYLLICVNLHTFPEYKSVYWIKPGFI